MTYIIIKHIIINTQTDIFPNLNISSIVLSVNGNSIDQIQNTFTIVLVLLGIAMALFLFYNLKNNLNRKKSKKAFSGSGQLFQPKKTEEQPECSILDEHPTPSAICRNDGIIVYVNKMFAEVFGSSPENMKMLLLFNILPAHISTALAYALEENKNDSALTSNGFYSPNTKNRYKVRWEKNNKNIQGQKSVILTLEKIPKVEYHDYTENQNKNVIQSILDSAPFAIFIEDNNGVILEVNNEACRFHKLNKDSIIGNTFSNLLPGDFRKELAHRHQLLQEKSGVRFRSVSYPKEDTPIPIEIQVNRINYFGTDALMFIVTNLTDAIDNKKKLNEFKIKAEESDRLKSSFLSNLSHEVRTPMNSILGFAELLAEPNINHEERKEFIGLIRESGKDLLSQINNMIDFSKIEAGLINLKVEICDLDVLFNHLKDFAINEFKLSNKVKLFFELPKEIIKNGIASDRQRLKQIFTVFLSNSIKYTTDGVIELGVKIKAPQLYEFYLRDTGIGIPEEKHRLVFEKFRQVDDHHSREFSGMGIGLSIASRLIQFLGGHQWVVSQPGKGSEFRFVLPDLIFPQGSPFVQVSCGPTTMINKAMIVAPTEEVYLDLCHNNKPANYQIFWAQNALEMKSMLQSNNIQYVLIALDFLPFWQELLPKIKLIESNSKLIALTDQLDAKRKERLVSMGFNDAVRTPINIPLLLNIMEKNELSVLHSLTASFNQN